MQIKRFILKKNILPKLAAVVIISGYIFLAQNIEIVNAQPNEINIDQTYDVKSIKNGWKQESGKWYYYENNNKKTGWLKDNDGSWYWLGKDGVMVSNQILKINGTYYKFYSSGKMSDEKNLSIARVNQCNFLNVRSGAGVNYSVVTKVYTNNWVEVLGTSNGWSKVELGNGTKGWVSSDYITYLTKPSIDEKIQKVIAVSKKQLGKPYVWGASGPSSFDCSGLMYYSYKNGADINLPRSSREQASVGVRVEKSNLKAGDLVFFNNGGSGINHVGMYIGNSEFIHSTQPGDTVKIHSINSSYYARTYVTARRVIN